jgi:uncharacterized protein YqhQ
MSSNKEQKKFDAGGQALIEGVMMRSQNRVCMAVRKPDGEIEVEINEIKAFIDKNKIFKLPIIRGVIAFLQSMIIGVKSLMYSAEFLDIEEEKPSKFEKFLQDKFGDKIQDITIYFSIFIALILALGLFGFVPTVLVGLANKIFDNRVIATILEGVMKIGIFLLYLYIISRLKDIQRVFEYHGAEHKTIFCYENDEELTVENVKKHTRFHPRCGTSFILIVLVISIIVFSFVSWESIVNRVLWKILLLPIVAGISYEVLKFSGKSNNALIKTLCIPGLALQKLTTREPDEKQIEVAIAALKGSVYGEMYKVDDEETLKEGKSEYDNTESSE